MVRLEGVKPLPFTPDARPAIIAPVQASTFEELRNLADLASRTPGIDLIEWRVDSYLTGYAGDESGERENSTTSATGSIVPLLYADNLPSRDDLRDAFRVLKATSVSVLVTLRTAREGGLVALAEVSEGEQSVYSRLITDLLSLEPEAIDIEFDRWDAEELIGRAQPGGAYVVASRHDWATTPTVTEIARRCEEMQNAGANIAKLAVMPGTLDDTLDLLAGTLAADDALRIPVIGIAMGPLGRASRIVGHTFGSAATFASLDRVSAPGQLSVTQLRAILDQIPSEYDEQ